MLRRFCVIVLSFILIFGVLSYGWSAVTLRVARFQNAYYDPVLEEAFKSFMEKNPDIKVVYENTPGEEYRVKLDAQLASGAGPDIFVIAGQWVPVYARDARIEPFPANLVKSLKKDFTPMAVSYTYWKNKYYGGPHEGGPRIYLFNKTIFKEAGLPLIPPKSWEELISYAQKTTKYDAQGRISQAGLGLNWGPDGVCAWHSFLKSAGGAFMDEKEREVKFNSTAGEIALQLWVDWVYKYKVASPKFLNPWDAFTVGKEAMYITGPWFVGFAQTSKLKLDYGAFLIPPQKAGGRHYVDDAPWLWEVNSASKNKEAAWKLMEFLMSRDVVYNLAKAGMAPFRTDVIDSDAWGRQNSTMAVFAQATKVGTVRPRVFWFEIERLLGDFIEKALNGEVTAGQALKSAADAITDKIKEEERVRGLWW